MINGQRVTQNNNNNNSNNNSNNNNNNNNNGNISFSIQLKLQLQISLLQGNLQLASLVLQEKTITIVRKKEKLRKIK